LVCSGGQGLIFVRYGFQWFKLVIELQFGSFTDTVERSVERWNQFGTEQFALRAEEFAGHPGVMEARDEVFECHPILHRFGLLDTLCR